MVSGLFCVRGKRSGEVKEEKSASREKESEGGGRGREKTEVTSDGWCLSLVEKKDDGRSER